jgi:hypothetical protein
VSALLPVTTILATTISNDFLKILVACFPLLVALIVWRIACRKDRKYRNFQELFFLYQQKELETTSTETISEQEPSVREFRNWMFKLQNAIPPDSKDVIVVFDNMDRLPADKVQVLWSSIHTFFAENTILKRIWVIVPFDRTHIADAFSDNGEKANHFINKTFSVVFAVPPAVLTDWWDFFKIKFTEAFGSEEIFEYAAVKSIFDRSNNEITPRKIIAFINDLVALKITWRNEMKLRYIALFVSHRDFLLKDPLTAILGKAYLQKVSTWFSEDDEVDQKIAALLEIKIQNC